VRGAGGFSLIFFADLLGEGEVHVDGQLDFDWFAIKLARAILPLLHGRESGWLKDGIAADDLRVACRRTVPWIFFLRASLG
jgi:hypothetical protein